jgi:hypothetical protein
MPFGPEIVKECISSMCQSYLGIESLNSMRKRLVPLNSSFGPTGKGAVAQLTGSSYSFNTAMTADLEHATANPSDRDFDFMFGSHTVRHRSSGRRMLEFALWVP